MGAGVLAYAVPATATGTHYKSTDHCDANAERNKVSSGFDGQDTTPTGDAWVQLNKGASAPCTSYIVLSIYKVPDTWDGGDFPGGNNSAVPQHVIAHDFGKLYGHKPLKLHVPVPDCGNFQIDLYYAPKQDDVDVSGTARFISGFLFSMDHGQSAPHGHPGNCTPPTTTPPVETTTPPVETTTPPVETTTPPVETTTPPVETTTPPVETTTPPVETTTPPVETTAPPTTSEAPVPSVSPTGTVPPIARPIPVAPQTPPRLAETGSNSTIPLLGIGSLLLVAGIGLAVAGRRKPEGDAVA